LIERVTIRTHFAVEASGGSQFCDQPQDVGEEVSQDHDLGHLKRDTPPVAGNLCADATLCSC
jgi:hypothetical protein